MEPQAFVPQLRDAANEEPRTRSNSRCQRLGRKGQGVYDPGTPAILKRRPKLPFAIRPLSYELGPARGGAAAGRVHHATSNSHCPWAPGPVHLPTSNNRTALDVIPRTCRTEHCYAHNGAIDVCQGHRAEDRAFPIPSHSPLSCARPPPAAIASDMSTEGGDVSYKRETLLVRRAIACPRGHVDAVRVSRRLAGVLGEK